MNDYYRRNGSSRTFHTTSNNLVLAKGENDKMFHYLLPIGWNYKEYDRLDVKNNRLINTEIEESFHSSISLTSEQIREKIDGIEYSLVYDNSDFFKCSKLIYERHYVKNTPTGLIFTASIEGEIACLLIVSRLTYSNPLGRSKYLSDKYNIQDEDDQRNYANKYMAWISRIVTVERHEGKGVAEHLCKNLPNLLKKVFPNNKLKGIEVITTWKLEDFHNRNINKTKNSVDEVIFDEKHDFLCRANYERIPVKIKTKKGNLSNRSRDDGGWNETQDFREKNDEGKIVEVSKNVARFYYVRKIAE